MIRNLSTREKMILGAGIAFCILVLFYVGIIAPYSSRIQLLERKIDAGQTQLQQVTALQQEYKNLAQQIRQISSDQQDVSGLFSFVENQVQQVAGRDKLSSMRPVSPVRHDDMVEEGLEVKIERISLRQVVDLLQRLEQSKRPLRVKGLDLKVRFENKSLFDTSLTISTFGKG
ncbi:MAG: type II secretion system protein GspM [Desulfuromonadaceae bacterium]